MSKYRVYELAKEFHTESKNVLQLLTQNGYEVKNTLSSVGEAERDLIRKLMTKGKPEEKGAPSAKQGRQKMKGVMRMQKVRKSALCLLMSMLCMLFTFYWAVPVDLSAASDKSITLECKKDDVILKGMRWKIYRAGERGGGACGERGSRGGAAAADARRDAKTSRGACRRAADRTERSASAAACAGAAAACTATGRTPSRAAGRRESSDRGKKRIYAGSRGGASAAEHRQYAGTEPKSGPPERRRGQ